MHCPDLRQAFGLTWNPFSPDVPVEALWKSPDLGNFCWRADRLVRQGGFALITGEPGTGKSTALRQLAHHLDQTPDVVVGVLSRPQSQLADFYRELGHLFGVPLAPHNRWAGFKSLRETWTSQIQATRYRPVVLIDEAQQALPAVLAELRILSSSEFDSRSLLTVVLAGDERLTHKFRQEELLPIASRIRVRLTLGHLQPQQLLEWIDHVLDKAGRPDLMSSEVRQTLAEHSAGNIRVLANMAHDLLETAARQGLAQIDAQLYFDLFSPRPPARPAS
jgi:type II secretory pathway predicted ATPase ExeA